MKNIFIEREDSRSRQLICCFSTGLNLKSKKFTIKLKIKILKICFSFLAYEHMAYGIMFAKVRENQRNCRRSTSSDMTKVWQRTVWVKKFYPRSFLKKISEWLKIFDQNFTHLLYVHIYGKLQNFIQVSLNLTKVCHIKCNHQIHQTSTHLEKYK